ncbi:MAG TPA: ABC transporter ATP-binding protein [Savagea sp.]
MKKVFSYALPYKIAMIVAFSLMLFELTVELFQPLFIAKIIDDGITTGDTSVVWTYGIGMMVLAIASFVAGVLNSYFAAHAAQGFGFDLRQATFKKLQSLTLSTFLTFPSSSLITRLTSDVTIVQNVLFMSLRIMARAPLLVIGSLIMAFLVNVKLAALLLVSAPFLAIFLYYMVKKGVAIFAQVQTKLDRVNRVTQEGLQAIRLVKAYLRGTYETNRFKTSARDLQETTVRAMRTMELILPILLFVMNVSLMAVLWFGAFEIQSNQIQVGELIAVINYGLRMTGAFSMFSFIIVVFSRAKASSERLEEILSNSNNEQEQLQTPSTQLKGRVQFDRVSFQYEGTEQPVLQNISFTVEPNERLAIMGPTGSGKSTLVQLIPRLFEPTEGEIILDDLPIQEWPLETLRQAVGFVPQRALLFSGTIEENLRWGRIDATEDMLIHSAKQAQIHSSIEQFSDGYQTVIGQRGVNLSGGQKQRLSIARALVREPELLILDDSTSALDVKTENEFLQALDALNTTTIIITQKVPTAQKADHILLLDEGKMAGYGTHEELLQQSELYQKLVASQTEEEVQINE